MAELFAMVRGDPRVWRLVKYDAHVLYLESHGGLMSTVASKAACRVGEAKHWRASENFATAWAAGGGDRFMGAAR